MKRIFFALLSVLFADLIFSGHVLAAERADIIAQAMDCADPSRESVGWGDVCRSYQLPIDERRQAIRQRYSSPALDSKRKKAYVLEKDGTLMEDSDARLEQPLIPRRRGLDTPGYEPRHRSYKDMPPKRTGEDVSSSEYRSASTRHRSTRSSSRDSALRLADPDRPKNIEFGVQLSSFNYETDDDWPYYYSRIYSVSNKVEKAGLLGGAFASYTWRSGDERLRVNSWGDLFKMGYRPTFARLELDAQAGEVSYDSHATSELTGFQAWEVESRVLIGYDLNVRDNPVTLYTGFGYRRFDDETGGYVDYFVYNYTQFTNKYSYYYLPLGLETQQKISPQWDLNLKFEGDFILDGSVQYYLSDIQGFYSGRDVRTDELLQLSPRNSKSKLDGGFGLRSACQVIRKREDFNWFIEPFIEYWHIRRTTPVEAHSKATNGSDYVSVYDDPANDYPLYKPLYDPQHYTLETGVKLGVQF